MNALIEQGWQAINPSDWTPEQRAEASAHRQAVALEILGNQIPENRDAALVVIGTAWDKTPTEQRTSLFYLSGELVNLSWNQLAVDKMEHALMTVLGLASDFNTAFRITHGPEAR